jgi:hypothetical protein
VFCVFYLPCFLLFSAKCCIYNAVARKKGHEPGRREKTEEGGRDIIYLGTNNFLEFENLLYLDTKVPYTPPLHVRNHAFNGNLSLLLLQLLSNLLVCV